MKKQQPIPVAELTEELLRNYPVWEFTNDDASDETAVRPVKKLPIRSGGNRLFGCEVLFADGTLAFALIGNLSLPLRRRTSTSEHCRCS